MQKPYFFQPYRVAVLLLLASLLCPALAAVGDSVALAPLVTVVGQPVAVRNAGDGSERLFVVLRSGTIVIIDDGVELPNACLDIHTLVDSSGGEQGLLGLAFHPNYEQNGYFYLNYTRNLQPDALDRTVIARYSVSATDPDLADPDSASVLLEFEQDFGNHNGGDIHFGPDSFLYISSGDGGSGDDPNNNAQSLNSLLGKLLRIDVDNESPPAAGERCGLNTGSYAIPAGNPFVAESNDCDEIWTYGLRNPWRFSFDRVTDELFIGDVGQNAVEEIDLQPPGLAGVNYAWRCGEDDQAFNNNPPCSGQLIEPIITYPH
jgi:glucose/arabinose dehydrogenase